MEVWEVRKFQEVLKVQEICAIECKLSDAFLSEDRRYEFGILELCLPHKGKQVTNGFYKNSIFLQKPDFGKTIKMHEKI